MVCSATLEEISQHCFENSPKHKRWFIFPSAGHELKTVTHWRSFFIMPHNEIMTVIFLKV